MGRYDPGIVSALLDLIEAGGTHAIWDQPEIDALADELRAGEHKPDAVDKLLAELEDQPYADLSYALRDLIKAVRDSR